MIPIDAARLRPGTLFAHRYLIERALGAGAMGTVFAARRVDTGERVALKCLLPLHHDDPGVIARFRREAHATSRLRSEHVAKVLDYGEARGGTGEARLYYLAMEHLDGQDLRASLERGPLSPSSAAELVSQACTGLAEAHALGIVHRDIKPANLFCTRRPDGTALVKILDFGIAKFQSPNASGDRLEMTEHSATMGSLSYMAPEQILDARGVDGRADIWSLGVVLYLLVSGARPFTGESITDIAYDVLTGAPRPLREVAPAVSPPFEAVVMRCLARQREERWSNAVELARALADFIEGPSSQPTWQRTAELDFQVAAQLRAELAAAMPANDDAEPPTCRVVRL